MEQILSYFVSNNLLTFFTILWFILIIILVVLIVREKKQKLEQELDIVNFSKVESISELNDIEKGASINEIESLLERMQQDLESDNSTDAIANFEQEQEEKSIISYQELVANKEKSEISLSEDLNNNKTDESIINDKHFKNTDFISPIYGRQDSNITYPKVPPFKNTDLIEIDKPIKKNNDLEKTLNISPINEEIKKNEEFLNALKEFRNSL